MTRTTKCLLTVLAVCLVSVSLLAGLQHLPSGKTTWVDRPTPTTVWLRHPVGTPSVIWTTAKVQIYPDTLRHAGYTAVSTTSTNFPVNMGYWKLDLSGVAWPHPDLDDARVSTNRLRYGEWADVEWDMHADRVIWPKP